MKHSKIEELVGFNTQTHMEKFKKELLELLTKYGMALRPGFTIGFDSCFFTTQFETVTTQEKMLEAFIKQSEERTRIYAEYQHEQYAKKPWFKYCCKHCKYRINHPVAGAMCLLIHNAETKCDLVKKWIETRK